MTCTSTESPHPKRLTFPLPTAYLDILTIRKDSLPFDENLFHKLGNSCQPCPTTHHLHSPS